MSRSPTAVCGEVTPRRFGSGRQGRKPDVTAWGAARSAKPQVSIPNESARPVRAGRWARGGMPQNCFGPSGLRGVCGTRYLGLRSRCSLQPRLSHDGPTALPRRRTQTGHSPTANPVVARADCLVLVPMASELLARHLGSAGTYVERRQEWAKGNRSSCRHHYQNVQLITQRRMLQRPRRRPAGRCTARVSALRPMAPRFPAFLSHQGALLCGFRGFSTRAVWPGR